MSEDFDWDADNILHIARHNVTPDEAEAMLMSNPQELGYEMVGSEERFSYVGSTPQGRFLVVVITERDFRIRVVTAYDAPRRSVMEYLRNR